MPLKSLKFIFSCRWLFLKFIYFQVRDDDVVLEIECGSNSALMYLSRLCQGSKGPCIWFQDAWITPNEFQYISGRETAKDWKRSIRHCGKSMKLLLTKGILTTHPPICDCDGCRITSPLPQVQSEFVMVRSTFFKFLAKRTRLRSEFTKITRLMNFEYARRAL